MITEYLTFITVNIFIKVAVAGEFKTLFIWFRWYQRTDKIRTELQLSLRFYTEFRQIHFLEFKFIKPGTQITILTDFKKYKETNGIDIQNINWQNNKISNKIIYSVPVKGRERG